MNGAGRMTPESLAAAAFRLRELGILIALGVAVLFFTVRATNFLSADNWQDIAKDVAIVVVVGIGETMVILTRNIDLSVASIVGLTAFLGRHARGPQRRSAGPGRRAGDGCRHAARTGQRSPGHRRPRAGDHRDAGHVGDLPGARVPGHRRRGDLRLPVARQLPRHRGIEAGRHADIRLDRSRCRARRCGHPALGAVGPTSARSARTRTRHGWLASTRGGASSWPS